MFKTKPENPRHSSVCSGFFLRSNDQGQCIQMMVDYHDRGNVGHLFGEGTSGWNTRAFGIDGVYDADKKLTGIKTASHRTAEQHGCVYSISPEDFVKTWKVNDWNTAKMRVQGTHPRITTWINGVKVCEFDGEKAQVERYEKEKVAATLGAKGSIAVQVHGGKGWPKGAKCRWKNIRIREL